MGDTFFQTNKKVLGVVGAGGKTTFIFTLANEMRSQGKKVIIATSTHMAYEPEHPFALWGDLNQIMENLNTHGYTVVGVFCEEKNRKENKNQNIVRKISCPNQADWTSLAALGDILLIEADGAKGRPLKIPADYEPVIPSQAEHVVGVIGLDAIGKPIEKCCHRPEDAEEFLGKEKSQSVTPEDVVKIAVSSYGLRKDVSDRPFTVVLNKADTAKQREYAGIIKEQVEMITGGDVMVTALRRREIAVILLAAGNSRRFGEENKLLHLIDGKPMILHTLEKLSALGCGSVIVVTQYEEVEALARQVGAGVYYNPHPQEGISSSVKIGVKANIQAKAWLFCVGDQPYLTLDTLEGLINTFLQQGKGIGAVSYEGKIMNPCIFSRKYLDELLELQGDTGGKHIIVSHRDDTTLYQLFNGREVWDIDKKQE